MSVANPENYIKLIVKPDGCNDIPRLLEAFTIAANAITASAMKKDGEEVYAEYLNRITDMVNILLSFRPDVGNQVEAMAIMVYIGTAIDYKRASSAETGKVILDLQLKHDPHYVKMVDWALERVPLSDLPDDLLLVTTAWLFNDAEKYADYLSDMPEELKLTMKRVHQQNYQNAATAALPASLKKRLIPAINKILAL